MKTFKFWTPVLAFLLVMVISIPIGFVSVGAGHGSYVWAKILFPLTLILPGVAGHLFGESTGFFIVCAIAQFPLYGALLGAANLRGKIVPVGLTLAAVHAIAAAALFILPETYT